MSEQEIYYYYTSYEKFYNILEEGRFDNSTAGSNGDKVYSNTLGSVYFTRLSPTQTGIKLVLYNNFRKTPADMKFNVALKFRVNGQDNKLFDPVGGDDKRDVYLYTGNEMHSVMSFLEDIYIFTENEKDAKSQAREEKRKIESYPFAKTFPNRTQVSLCFLSPNERWLPVKACVLFSLEGKPCNVM